MQPGFCPPPTIPAYNPFRRDDYKSPLHDSMANQSKLDYFYGQIPTYQPKQYPDTTYQPSPTTFQLNQPSVNRPKVTTQVTPAVIRGRNNYWVQKEILKTCNSPQKKIESFATVS